MKDIKVVAGIGGGIIGGSWAVLFAMKGKEVRLYRSEGEIVYHGK